MIDTQTIARGFHAALVAGRTYDPPSTAAELEMEAAYAVQHAFNRLRAANDAVAGFKAAVNAEALQRALGLAGPVSGTLFASGARPPGATVERSAFRNLLIETELGFRTVRRIAAPVDSEAALRAAIATVAPMFELADPGFARVPIRGTDMIAANAACGGFVEGPARPLDGFDLNAERVRLLRDGELLHEARSDELMGDHWQALRWLVNAVVAQGLVIEAGQLLMTGSLGAAHAAAPGRYSAEFSSLATIEVTVV